jgi:hypothetical protein
MAYWDVGSNTLTPDDLLDPNTIRFRSNGTTAMQQSDVIGAFAAFPVKTNQRVEIENGIQFAGNSVFQNQSMVEIYFLPNDTIYKLEGANTFANCESLAMVDFSQCTKLGQLGGVNTFWRSGRTPDPSQGRLPGLTVRLPPTMQSMSSRAFIYSTVVRIVFPASCVSLGDYSFFYQAEYLKFVDLSATNITTIPPNCFNGAGDPDGLVVLLPPGLIEIQSNAFASSTLTTIGIPSGVTISDSAFSDTVEITTWEAARIAAEEEATRIAAEEEATRIAAEKEAARIAAEKEAARIAAEKESFIESIGSLLGATGEDRSTRGWIAFISGIAFIIVVLFLVMFFRSRANVKDR